MVGGRIMRFHWWMIYARKRKGNCEGMDGDYGGVDEGIKRST